MYVFAFNMNAVKAAFAKTNRVLLEQPTNHSVVLTQVLIPLIEPLLSSCWPPRYRRCLVFDFTHVVPMLANERMFWHQAQG